MSDKKCDFEIEIEKDIHEGLVSLAKFQGKTVDDIVNDALQAIITAATPQGFEESLLHHTSLAKEVDR